jgi:hypothetical protein
MKMACTLANAGHPVTLDLCRDHVSHEREAECNYRIDRYAERSEQSSNCRQLQAQSRWGRLLFRHAALPLNMCQSLDESGNGTPRLRCPLPV